MDGMLEILKMFGVAGLASLLPAHLLRKRNEKDTNGYALARQELCLVNTVSQRLGLMVTL